MARTKQTARKSTGGKAPRKQLSVRKKPAVVQDGYGYDSDLDMDEADVSGVNELALLETFAFSTDRAALLDSLVEGSASFYYFTALEQVRKLIVQQNNGKSIQLEAFDEVLDSLKVLEGFEEYEYEVLRQTVRLIQLEQSQSHMKATLDSEEVEAVFRDAISYWEKYFGIKYPTNTGLPIENEDSTASPSKTVLTIRALNQLSIEESVTMWIEKKSGTFETSCFPSLSGTPVIYDEIYRQLCECKNISISMEQRIAGLISFLTTHGCAGVCNILNVIQVDLQNSWKTFFPFSLSIEDNNTLEELDQVFFGSRRIHVELSLVQLQGLAESYPELLNNSYFVREMVQQFSPSYQEAEKIRKSLSTDFQYLTTAGNNRAEAMVYLKECLDFLLTCGPSDDSTEPDVEIVTARSTLLYYRMVYHYETSTLTLEDFLDYLNEVKKPGSLKWDSNRPTQIPLPQMQQMQMQQIPQLQRNTFSNANRRGSAVDRRTLKIAPSCSVDFVYNFPVVPLDKKKSQIKELLSYFLLNKHIQNTGEELEEDRDPSEIIRPFISHFSKAYLLRLLAKVKLMDMAPNPSLWCKLMGKNPEALKKLTELQVLKFSSRNPSYYEPDDKVSISIQIKNVDRLIVQVYEVNVAYYYAQHKRSLNVDAINLDGLVANYQESMDTTAPPIQQMTKQIEIPLVSQAKAGVFVVEIVGGSKACRALIRKGKLHVVHTSTLGGEKMEIFQGDRLVTHECSILFNDKEYHPSSDKRELYLPYYDAIKANVELTPEPLSKTNFVLLSRHTDAGHESNFIVPFKHSELSFVLIANMFVDSEQLLHGQRAQLLIRPTLMLKNQRCTLSILKNISLTMTTSFPDSEMVEEVPVELKEGEDTIHSFHITRDATRITFQIAADAVIEAPEQDQMTARVARFTEVKDSFSVFIAERSIDVYHSFLERDNNQNYTIRMLGRSGEPYTVKSTVMISLTHKLFLRSFSVHQNPDNNGIIHLGKLNNFTCLKLGKSSWPLDCDLFHSFWAPKKSLSFINNRTQYLSPSLAPIEMCCLVGQEILLPLPFLLSDQLTLSHLFLFRRVTNHSDVVQYSVMEHLRVDEQRNVLAIALGEPGDYELTFLKTQAKILISMVSYPSHEVRSKEDMAKRSGFILTDDYELRELNNRHYLQITGAMFTKDSLEISLVHASEKTRIHVVARNFITGNNNIGSTLSVSPVCNPKGLILNKAESVYKTTRTISEEYQYILHRRSIKDKLPGNPLDIPSLLLHPFSVSDTKVTTNPSRDESSNGFSKNQSASATRNNELLMLAMNHCPSSPHAGFLAQSSVTKYNIKPERDESGTYSISIPLEDGFIHAREFYICALDDTDVSSRHVFHNVPKSLPYVDQSLSKSEGFEAGVHLAEHRGISLLQPDDIVTLTHTDTLKTKVYDSVAKLFSLLDAASDFKVLYNEYVTRWNSLTPSQKQIYYDSDASHELSLFIYMKDRSFFDEVIRGMLENKMEKRFLDLFLLGADLSAFLRLENFLSLSLLERILLAVSFPERRGDILQNMKAQPTSTSLTISEDFSLALTCSGCSVAHSIEFRADQPQEGSSKKRRKQQQGRGGKGGRLKKQKSSNYEEEEQYSDDSDDYEDECYFDSDVKRSCMLPRRKQKSSTKVLEEKQFHDGTVGDQKKPLINSSNPFFLDALCFLVEHKERKEKQPFAGFLSSNILCGCTDFTSLMFILSIIDLPFEGNKENEALQRSEEEMNKVFMKAISPSIVFHLDIRTIHGDSENSSDLLVNQTICTNGSISAQRYPEEFVQHKSYEMRLSLLNITNKPLHMINILAQIPTGSIPIGNNTLATISKTISVPAQKTKELKFLFYFKQPGSYTQYPPHVSQEGKIMAVVEVPQTFEVVSEKKSKINELSWLDVSTRGTNESILDFIGNPKTNRLSSLQLGTPALLGRLHSKPFFLAFTNCLRSRFLMHSDIWKFSFMHGDGRTIGEYLANNATIRKRISFCCPSLGLFPSTQILDDYKHKEFSPLIHSRIHSKKIMNIDVTTQYKTFLTKITLHNPIVTDLEFLEGSYYLILQNRTSDAYKIFTEHFGKPTEAKGNSLPCQIQFDYMRAYFDFYFATDNPFELAKTLSSEYISRTGIPSRWKELFQEILSVLSEFDRSTNLASNPTLNTKNPSLNQSEPSLKVLTVKDDRVDIQFQNIAGEMTVNFYLMDVEATFSFEPFANFNSSRCCFIQPSHSMSIPLPFDKHIFSLDVPESFVNAQVMLELKIGSAICVTVPHFCSRMDVALNEVDGTLRVNAKGNGEQKLSGIYVKIFAQVASQSIFYKDGYTDLLGCFDYFSLSDNINGSIKKLAILLHSDSFGSHIQAVNPPQIPSSGQDSRIVKALSQ